MLQRRTLYKRKIGRNLVLEGPHKTSRFALSIPGERTDQFGVRNTFLRNRGSIRVKHTLLHPESSPFRPLSEKGLRRSSLDQKLPCK